MKALADNRLNKKLSLANKYKDELLLFLEPEGVVLTMPPNSLYEVLHEETSNIQVEFGQDDAGKHYIILGISYSLQIYCNGNIIHTC